MWSLFGACIDIYYTLVLYSLTFALLITCVAALISEVKLPRPSVIQVEKIFGNRKRYLTLDRQNWSGVICHRGGGGNLYPENTLEAIRHSWERGCVMVEFDVSMTKDSCPVLFHDENLSRVIGIDQKISDINWADLQKVRHPGGEQIPRLEEAVDLCMALEIRFIIDLKNGDDKVIDEILNIFENRNETIYSMGVVSSFHFSIIYKIRASNPMIVGAMAWRPSHFALPLTLNFKQASISCEIIDKLFSALATPLVYRINDFCMLHVYWWLLGLSAVLVHKDALNIERVQKLSSRKLHVFAWTVNSQLEKEYIERILGIGYLTDNFEKSVTKHEERSVVENLVCVLGKPANEKDRE